MSKQDIYTTITNSIIESLEQNIAPWVPTWEGAGGMGLAVNHSTGNAYKGINVLLGLIAQYENEYPTNRWLTYLQAKKMGAQVRKGEKGTTMVRYQPLFKRHKDDEKPLSIKEAARLQEQGVELVFAGAFVRSFNVFNIAQCDGIEYTPPKASAKDVDNPAAEFLEGIGANVMWGLNPAYRPSSDVISVPTLEHFHGKKDEQFAAAAHEAVHWTGHSSRLDRLDNDTFSEIQGLQDASFKEKYAFEELIAELGAAFLCAEHGFVGALQHDAYIKSWLKALKNDSKFIFQASSAAQEAVDYINDLLP